MYAAYLEGRAVLLSALDFRDDLLFLALTIEMEAGNQSDEGMVAVGYVVLNSGGTITDAIFKPYRFSAWNTTSPGRGGLDEISATIFWRCYRAACAAYFRLVPDPTAGATHYLNPTTVRVMTGKLPDWYDPAKVTAVIGAHEFLKLA